MTDRERPAGGLTIERLKELVDLANELNVLQLGIVKYMHEGGTDRAELATRAREVKQRLEACRALPQLIRDLTTAVQPDRAGAVQLTEEAARAEEAIRGSEWLLDLLQRKYGISLSAH
jgi:hypothetical protein